MTLLCPFSKPKQCIFSILICFFFFPHMKKKVDKISKASSQKCKIFCKVNCNAKICDILLCLRYLCKCFSSYIGGNWTFRKKKLNTHKIFKKSCIFFNIFLIFFLHLKKKTKNNKELKKILFSREKRGSVVY